MPRNAGRVKIILVIESPSFYSFQFKKEPGTRCLCSFPALFVDNVDNFSFCSEKWALFSKNLSILAPPLFINSLNPLIFRGFPPFPGSFLVVPSFLILLTVILIEYIHAVAIPKRFYRFQFLERDQLTAVSFYQLSIFPYRQPLCFQQHSVLDSSHPDYLHISQK